MGAPGFFRGLTSDGLDAELYVRAFSDVAEALPGLGGLETFDRFTLGEVVILQDTIRQRREKEAAAYRAAAASARNKARR